MPGQSNNENEDMENLDYYLIAVSIISAILLGVAIGVADWRTCGYKSSAVRNSCIRDGLFKICYGTCFQGTSLYESSSCVPMKQVSKFDVSGHHKTVAILMLVCIGMHGFCCITGIIAALTNQLIIMFLNTVIEFIAALVGVAAVSLYTNKYGFSYCTYGTVFYCAWVGVFMLFGASFFFLCKGASMIGQRKPIKSDKANLVT